MPLLVLITGTGRSGTSTMSGSLHHLGLQVPGPHLGANESNPKGFFESRWAVRFHKEICDTAHTNIFDSRPHAFDRVQQVLTPDHEAEVAAFLERRGGDAEQVVVKDPRSVWTQALWKQGAARVGREIRYVSMLRHPAEVIGSRATYYASDEEAKRRRYETFNVARWVNSSLISERETRGERRAFVRYTDLLEDWRPAMARLRDQLGLTFDPDVDVRPHPVDEFIDPDLRRHAVTWAELEVPTALQEIAEAVWQQIESLADEPDRDVSAAMDELAARYARLLQESAAISHDALEEARESGRARALEETTADDQIPAELPPGRRAVDDVAGRELLKVALARATGRLRRR